MGVCKNLYSDDIPRALREEGTVVIVFQTEINQLGRSFKSQKLQMQSKWDGQVLFSFLAEKYSFR